MWTLWLDNVSDPRSPTWPTPCISPVRLRLRRLALLLRARACGPGRPGWPSTGQLGLTLAALAAGTVFEPVRAATHGGAGVVATTASATWSATCCCSCSCSSRSWPRAGARAAPGPSWEPASPSRLWPTASTPSELTGAYVAGAWLDVMWRLEFVLVAVAAWQLSGSPGLQPRDGPRGSPRRRNGVAHPRRVAIRSRPGDRAGRICACGGGPEPGPWAGCHLMERLIAVARDRRVKRLTGLVLCENRPMLDLLRQLGFSIATGADPDDSRSCVRFVRDVVRQPSHLRHPYVQMPCGIRGQARPAVQICRVNRREPSLRCMPKQVPRQSEQPSRIARVAKR